MVLALAKEQSLVLVVYRSNVDLRVSLVVVAPVRANARRCKVDLPLSAQLRKDVPADALISESHKFLLKVFAHLVQHDLLVVQFQLSLERVHIAEPEADEVVRNIVQALPGTLWILFGDGNVLDNKTKVDQCFKVRRNS